MEPAVSLIDRDPHRWFPAHVAWTHGSEAEVTWLYGEEERFSQPFLHETFQAWMRRPVNLAFAPVTSLEQLKARAADLPGMVPAGFIFHVSRCGSTLLSRLLAQAPDCLVLSEPPPLDAIVRANQEAARLTHEAQVETLRAMVSALGQPRAPGQDRLIIKLDAWHGLQVPLLRAAFPYTPWVFLYREPVEVMTSQMKQRGVHTVPGVLPPALFGLDDPSSITPDEYCARVLGALYAAGLEAHRPGHSLLVNYQDLPGAAVDIARHFGLDVDGPDIRAAMAREAGRDAKRGQVFVPDGAAKRAEASLAAQRAAATWLVPPYQRLEQVRLAGVGAEIV